MAAGQRAHSRIESAVFVLLLAGSLAALLYLFRSFATDVVLGLLCAGLARPVYLRGTQRLDRPALVAGAVTLLVGFVVALPTMWLLTSLARQAAHAYGLVSEWLASGAVHETFFGENFWAERLRRTCEALGLEYSVEAMRSAVGNMASSAASEVSGELNAVLSNLLGAIYHFILWLVVVYYGLIDGPRLKRRVFELSPLPDDEEQLFVDKFADVGAAILFGNGIGSAAQGLVGGLTLWAFGIPSAVFWGTIMALFAFLPLVGISIVIVPVALFLAVSGRPVAALFFFGINMLQALLIENVVKTKLIGDRMQMHNGLIFFSLLGGLSSFGVVGILYGPLLLTLFVTAQDLYERGYRQSLLAS